MKDHEIAHIHNQLKKAAIECHGNGSLRASLAHVVSPLVSEVRQLQAENIMLTNNIESYEATERELRGFIETLERDLEIMSQMRTLNGRLCDCSLDLAHKLGEG